MSNLQSQTQTVSWARRSEDEDFATNRHRRSARLRHHTLLGCALRQARLIHVVNFGSYQLLHCGSSVRRKQGAEKEDIHHRTRRAGEQPTDRLSGSTHSLTHYCCCLFCFVFIYIVITHENCTTSGNYRLGIGDFHHQCSAAVCDVVLVGTKRQAKHM